MKSKFLILLAAMALPLQAQASISRLMSSPAVWVDEKGESHRLLDWGKGPVVFTMIYGNCHKTCPNLTFVKLREVQKALDERKISANFVIGTFDPDNDSTAVLRGVKKRQGNRGNWHFIRGSSAQTDELAHELGLDGFFHMSPNDIGDEVVHKFRIVYFDPVSNQERALDYSNKDVQTLFTAPVAQPGRN